MSGGQWTDATEKLVAFLFGNSVHYIADEFFEGLTSQMGRGQGMVEQLGAFDLNNSGIGDNSEGCVSCLLHRVVHALSVCYIHQLRCCSLHLCHMLLCLLESWRAIQLTLQS
jgi:hypothetical protein